VDAVEHMHSKGISHHDIKPENISFDPDTYAIKLFDFGLAVGLNLDQPPLTDWDAGSPLYMAPEVLLNDTHNPFIADIWSLGILFYELLFGETPFSKCKTVEELGKMWAKYKAKPPTLDQCIYSPSLKILIQKMLTYDPEHRITVPEIKSTYFSTPSPSPPLHLRKGKQLTSLRRTRNFSLNSKLNSSKDVNNGKKSTGESNNKVPGRRTRSLTTVQARADLLVKSLSKHVLVPKPLAALVERRIT